VVHSLPDEHCDQVDGSKGDRFACDELHRLNKAWMGVHGTAMAARCPCNSLSFPRGSAMVTESKGLFSLPDSLATCN
jgi:hypothetical protein